jgi:hypothetical protein
VQAPITPPPQITTRMASPWFPDMTEVYIKTPCVGIRS